MSGAQRHLAANRAVLSAARRAYQWLTQSPAGQLPQALLGRRLRERVPVWTGQDVAGLLRDLGSADVVVWLGGGWGVDALLGEETCSPGDLDLFYGGDDTRLRQALEGVGFDVRTECFRRGELLRTATARLPQGPVISLVTTRDPNLLRQAGAVTVGRVAGEPVPCVSSETQLWLHSRYFPTASDRRDVERLCAAFGLELPAEFRDEWSGRPSALMVPVLEAEPLVARHRARHDPAAKRGMPAHITVLFPFMPASRFDANNEIALRVALASFRPFRFRLTRTARFPDLLYLAPEPAQPFVELTNMVSERWPEYPPYGGIHDSVVPHLTVADGSIPRALQAKLERGLPIETEATEVWLLTESRSGRWSVDARFPLGMPGRTSATPGDMFSHEM